MSCCWSCCQIQWWDSWYLTICCKSIILRVSMISVWVNLQSLTSGMFLLLGACIPLWSCLAYDSNSSHLRGFHCYGYGIKDLTRNLLILRVMVPFSVRVCRACLSSHSNIIPSCPEAWLLESSVLVLMPRASRKLIVHVKKAFHSLARFGEGKVNLEVSL